MNEYYEYGLEGFLPDVIVPLANRPEVDSWKGFEGLTIVRRKVTAGPWTEYTGEFVVGDRVQQVPEESGVRPASGTVTNVRGGRVHVEWDCDVPNGYARSVEWPQHLRKV